MNMWGFNPDVFSHLDRHFTAFLGAQGEEPKSEFYIPTVVNTLIQEGLSRVRMLLTRADWFGVTYSQDRPLVVASIRRLIAEGQYPERLWR